MPTPHVTPPGSGTASTWQIGTYNAVADTWTLVLDLNDRSTWFIKSYDLAQPEKKISRSGNPRTQGERITNERYGNRYISLTLQLRSTTTLAAIDSAIHTLEAALSNTPFMLRFAEAQAAQYSYAIVKSWQHNIPQDPLQRLAMVKTSVTLVLECEPFFLGDKLYLDNLVTNPGFEAPSGPAVTVFADTFANVNAYTLIAGSAPSVVSNVMTIPLGATVSFGSPAWGAVNQWSIRFKYVTGLFANFDLHFTDASNKIQYQVGSGSQDLYHYVSGTSHALATATTAALTNGNFYWAVVTQFPTVPGDNPYVAATLYNDNAGAVGTQVATVGPVATFDAVTALTGKMAIEASGAALAVGGAFTNVHTVSLFGPGGWLFTDISGTASAISSGAWDQTTANTYPNGPVTSYGAARIDLAPAGTVDAFWSPYTGGAPAGTNAMPIAAAGNTLAASVVVKSSAGVAGTTIIRLILQEWNASGTFLRGTTLQSLTGAQTAWTQLSGTVVTGANAAYASVVLEVLDTNAGVSANQTIWFDNVQCWNQTTTGQTTMPYCELRFPQSPAQLLVSGLVGDVPAPAFVAAGTYLSSWGGNTILRLVLGRRLYSTAAARLVTADIPNTALGSVPTVLDSTAYGGYYMNGQGGYDDNPLIGHPGDLQGVYHLFSRYYSGQAAGNLPNITTQVFAADQNTSLMYAPSAANVLWIYRGPTSAPLTASATWTPADAGQIAIPLAARGSQTDLQQNYVVVGAIWNDSGPVVNNRLNWEALIPVDAGVLSITANNPTSAGVTVTNSWFWQYVDGLVPTQIVSMLRSSATSYSIETTPLPSPAHGSGGPGTLSSTSININTIAAPYMTLDPTAQVNGASVNQLAGFMTDTNGDVLPLHCSIQYFPYYLDPR